MMKKIILTLAISIGLYASNVHTSSVIESLDSGGYTYMKVQDGKKRYWIAMTQRIVKPGDTITYTEQGWMKKFHSKTLNRTFENILFAGDVTASNTQKMINDKPNIMKSAYDEKGIISIAELFKNRDKYAGKIITLKGKVTKTSHSIMKLNWVHIQDGSSYENMNDLVFTTTQNPPKIGEIVYAVKDKDFGYGYFYPIIIQEATFKH
jgi:hypothetical protein